MWTYDHNQVVDLNLTAQRSHLPDGAASILIGLDNTRPGRLRTADPRKPLSVASPNTDPITFAQGSDFSGRYTSVQADEFDTTDYVATANPATALVISAVGLNKGIIFNQDMVGGLLILDTQDSELYVHKIASVDTTTVANDTVTFERASAVQFATGNTFAILWEKEYDKRGIWLTDGRRIFLVQNDTIVKFLDIGTDTALGSKWHGSRISRGEYMFVNDLYAPRIISLNDEAAGSTQDLSQLAGMSVPEAEIDRTLHASDLTTETTGGFIELDGDYRVRIRFVDEKSGAVSKFVQLHTTSVIGSDDFIVVPSGTTTNKLILDFQAATYTATTGEDDIPNVPRATHIEIYRTDEGGVSYWLERSLPISRDGNYIENGDVDLKLANASLYNRKPLNILDEAHGGLPPIGRKITSIDGVTLIAGKASDSHVDVNVFSNRAADDTPIDAAHTHELSWPVVEDDNTVYPSALDAFLPESFNPQDKLRLSDIGDSFQNFGTAGGIAVAVMTEGAYRLQAVGTSLIKTTIGERGIGTAWPESVVSVGKYVIWASPKGMIAYDTLFDRSTGGYEYLSSKSGEFLESYLAEAFVLQDDIFCGYDQRDDILRVRRVSNLFGPYKSVQINDIIKWTAGGNSDIALAITDAAASSLEWTPAVGTAIAEGDTFDVLLGAAPVSTGAFTAIGDTTSTLSLLSDASTPFSNTAVGDFVVFTNGQNDNQVRLIDTVSAANDKITWVDPLPFVPSNNDTLIIAADTTSLAEEEITFNKLSNGRFFTGMGASGAGDDDPGAGTDVTDELLDGDAAAAFTIVSGTAGKFTIDGGFGIVSGAGTFTFRVIAGGSTNNLSMALMPYTDSNSVDFSVRIIETGAGSEYNFVLTQAFKDALAPQAGGAWAVRLAWENGGVSTGIAEVTMGLIFGRIEDATTTTLVAVSQNPWSDDSVVVDDIVHYTNGVNPDIARRVSAVSAGTLTLANPLNTAPAAGDDFKIYADTTVDSYTITQTLWTLGVGGVTASSGTPFVAVDVGDVFVLPDETPDLARTISAVTAGNQLAWVDPLPAPPDDNDNWKILDKDTPVVSDTVEEEKMNLATTSLEIFGGVGQGVDRVLQYSFKLKTWSEFDNDTGINYAESVFADTAVLQSPALYSPTKQGSVFEINSRQLVHPYDSFTQQAVMESEFYTITPSTIQIDVSTSTRKFRTEMLGDSIRIISSTARDGSIREIVEVTAGAIGTAHVITFAPAVLGLAIGDSFVIGGNHLKIRFAPYFGTDYSSVKTVYGCVVHAAPGARHAGNSNWTDPPTGKIDVRCYQNLSDTPISEKLSEISIFDEDDTARITDDRYSAVEGQGNTLELEIESRDAKTDFRLDHISCDVVEHVIDLVDASTEA